MVPKGWQIGSLSDLADTVMGFAFKSADFTPNGIPLLRMGNLYQNTLDFERNPVFLPASYQDEYKRFVVKPGDLVMSMTGTMGKRDYGFTVEIPKNSPESLLNQRVMKFIPNDKTSAGFLLYLLRSEIILSRLYSFPGGTKQANLSAKQVQDLPAPIPPYPEQKKIAQILSTWDKTITTTEQLIKNSQQQKKALMQQLLTSKKRLLDKNGVRFSGEWQACQLSDVVSSLDSGVSVNGVEQDVEASHFVLKTSCLSDGVFAPEEVKRVVEEKEITRLKEPLRDDSILISRMNTPALVGANSYVELAPDNTYLPDRLWQVKATQSKVLMRWLAFWFSSEKTRTALSDLASGTSGSMKNISKKSVLAMSIQCPSLEEQQKIAAVLTAADQEISALQQKLDGLKQEKKALMQQLLTGKRRVLV
ncbi:TPA: hypothetical protein GRI60_20960 [Vibrio parahaemolyticus]|nr:hypothetical protein [Vibrio parahaemolyticus]